MLETETVLDRRRLRRSVSLWRGAGLAAVLIAIGALTLGNNKLASLAGEVLSGSDIGLPLGPEGKAVLLPANIDAFTEGLEVDVEQFDDPYQVPRVLRAGSR